MVPEACRCGLFVTGGGVAGFCETEMGRARTLIFLTDTAADALSSAIDFISLGQLHLSI